MSPSGPSVWTGRALQAESDDLEKLVLRICIRPIHGAFELLAIMDIRARSISFASRPRRPEGPPDHERAGETFLHLLISTRRPRWETPTQKLFWISALGRRLGDAGFITALLSQHRPGDPCQLVGESGGQNVGVEALSGAREPDPEAPLPIAATIALEMIGPMPGQPGSFCYGRQAGRSTVLASRACASNRFLAWRCAAFTRGRDFSAWIGLVPKQMSTGDRTILGRRS